MHVCVPVCVCVWLAVCLLHVSTESYRGLIDVVFVYELPECPVHCKKLLDVKRQR